MWKAWGTKCVRYNYPIENIEGGGDEGGGVAGPVKLGQ